MPLAASFLQFQTYTNILFSFFSQITFNSDLFLFPEEKLQYYNSTFSKFYREQHESLLALKLVAIVVISTFRIVVATETTRLWIAFSFRPVQYKGIKLTFKPVELVGSNGTRPRRTLLSSAYVFVRDANPPICIGLR